MFYQDSGTHCCAQCHRRVKVPLLNGAGDWMVTRDPENDRGDVATIQAIGAKKINAISHRAA